MKNKVSKTKVKEIQKFLMKLESAGIDAKDVFFAEVTSFRAQGAEHKEARYPGLSKYHQNHLWNQQRRAFNATYPRTKIVSLPTEIQTPTGIIKQWFIKIAYGRDALKAKEHQDKLNIGGLQKSEDLYQISVDQTLLKQDQKRRKEILLRAGIQ